MGNTRIRGITGGSSATGRARLADAGLRRFSTTPMVPVMHPLVDLCAAAALRLLGRLQMDTADRAGGALGVFAFHLGIRRQVVRDGLGRLGMRGGRRRTTARRSFATIGASMVACWALGNGRAAGLTRRPLVPRSGSVLVIGHTGMWLAAPAAAAGIWTGVHAYFKPLKGRAMQAVFSDLWRATGVTPVDVAAEGGRDALQVLRALRSGQAVGLAADQEPGSRRWVPGWFLGQACRLHAGPAVLAHRARVPVVVGAVIRRRAGCYQVIMSKPLASDRSEQDLAQAIADRLGALIAAVPGQHFWHHRRFKRQATPTLPDTGRWREPGLGLLLES